MESKKIPIETYLSKLRQYINKWCFSSGISEIENLSINQKIKSIDYLIKD